MPGHLENCVVVLRIMVVLKEEKGKQRPKGKQRTKDVIKYYILKQVKENLLV